MIAHRALLLAAMIVAARGARAQDSTQTLVRVRLSDSAGVRVADAELTIIRGLHDTVAAGHSSASGEWSLFVARNAAPYQLIARKIGLNRAQRFFMAASDSVNVALRLGRIVQALSPVVVNEREDAKRKSYFIDADDIANSNRPLVDASDILIKLKQDMIYSRGGAKGPCEAIRNIWINGVAVIKGQALPGQGPQGGPTTRMSYSVVPPSGGANGRAFYPVSETAAQRASVKGSPAAGIGAVNLTVLEQIRPEHIEQMTYKDCWDTSMRGLYTQNALFIVLKAGIRYERNIGTFSIEGGRTAR